ncbi:MAG TPA: hypothetical protein P5534_17355 [Candidatus Paceibacterota bacterium]|nr:hypothetical protein [Candidatus Paceibacterota bacterium]HRZ58776.1 hypothetical protein [Candidatus Paceibacterota bacterium]
MQMRVGEILIVVVVVGVGFLALKKFADKTSVPREILLASSTNQWRSSTFPLPKGKNFNLLLGLPEGTSVAEEQFSGVLELSISSNVVTRIPFNAEHTTPASWLSKYKLDAYILTWPTNRPLVRLDNVLAVGSSYSLAVKFSNQPPAQATVWLTYLQEWKDRSKH